MKRSYNRPHGKKKKKWSHDYYMQTHVQKKNGQIGGNEQILRKLQSPRNKPGRSLVWWFTKWTIKITDETENINRLITGTEIEIIIKKLQQTRVQEQIAS